MPASLRLLQNRQTNRLDRWSASMDFMQQAPHRSHRAFRVVPTFGQEQRRAGIFLVLAISAGFRPDPALGQRATGSSFLGGIPRSLRRCLQVRFSMAMD